MSDHVEIVAETGEGKLRPLELATSVVPVNALCLLIVAVAGAAAYYAAKYVATHDSNGGFVDGEVLGTLPGDAAGMTVGDLLSRRCG